MFNLKKLCFILITLVMLGCNSSNSIKEKGKNTKDAEDIKNKQLPKIPSDLSSKIHFNKDGSEIWPVINPSQVSIAKGKQGKLFASSIASNARFDMKNIQNPLDIKNAPKSNLIAQTPTNQGIYSVNVVTGLPTKPLYPPSNWTQGYTFPSGADVSAFYPRVVVAIRDDGTYGVCWSIQDQGIYIQNMNKNHTKDGNAIEFSQEIENGYKYYTTKDYKPDGSGITKNQVYTKILPADKYKEKVEHLAGCAATNDGYIFGYTIGRHNNGDEQVLSRMYKDYKREYLKFRRIQKDGTKVTEKTFTGMTPKLHSDFVDQDHYHKRLSAIDKKTYDKEKNKASYIEKKFREYVRSYFMVNGSPYKQSTFDATIAKIKPHYQASKHAVFGPLTMGTAQIATGASNNFGVMFAYHFTYHAGRGGEHQGSYLGFLGQDSFGLKGIRTQMPSINTVYTIHSIQQKLMYTGDSKDGVYTAMSLNDGPSNVFFQAFDKDGQALTSLFLLLKTRDKAGKGLHGNMPFAELGGALPVKNTDHQKFGVLFTASPNYPERTDWNLYYILVEQDKEKHQQKGRISEETKQEIKETRVNANGVLGNKVIMLTNYAVTPQPDNSNPIGKHAVNAKIAYYGDNFFVMYQESEIYKVKGGQTAKINATYGMIITPEGKILYGPDRLDVPIFRETNLQNLPNGDIIWATGTPKPERNLLIHTIQYNPKLK